MSNKHEKDETVANPPGVRGPKLRIAVPLSVSASTEIKTKAAVYRGQLTQEQFIGLLGSEIEQHLPRILRQIVSRLESERRQRLGLDTQEMSPVATPVRRDAEEDEEAEGHNEANSTVAWREPEGPSQGRRNIG